MKIENAKTREGKSLSVKTIGSSRTSVLSAEKRSEINYINVDLLIPYHKQARIIFDQHEIDVLADTIREHGIRQPLTVLRKDYDSPEFEVISGERRLRAAKSIGLKQVPCIIIDNIDKAEEIALIENIQRKDLHPIELSRALHQLISKLGWGSQTELCKKIGYSNSQLSELLKLSELSDAVQDIILDRNFRGRENFRKLLTLPSDAAKIGCINSLYSSSDIKTADHKKTSSSVLRVSIAGNEFKIQKSYISKLSDEQKAALRVKLLELLEDLT